MQCEQNIKKIVHPKMKILSSFTHPYVNPNLQDFFFSYTDHKRRYYYSKYIGSHLTFWIIDFHFMHKKGISQNILFRVRRSHRGLEQHEGE